MKHPLRQEYLISYDIEDNKIRMKIFKELQKYGLRNVQKSVFWGYLTMAELKSIEKYFSDNLKRIDKAFITRANFNGKKQSFFIGHLEEDFKDWLETYVI